MLVYSPRYHGMGPAVRAAAERAGVFLRLLDVRAALTPEQRSTHMFTDTRLVLASGCKHALEAIWKRSGELRAGSDEDYYPGYSEEVAAAAAAAGGAGGDGGSVFAGAFAGEE